MYYCWLQNNWSLIVALNFKCQQNWQITVVHALHGVAMAHVVQVSYWASLHKLGFINVEFLGTLYQLKMQFSFELQTVFTVMTSDACVIKWLWYITAFCWTNLDKPYKNVRMSYHMARTLCAYAGLVSHENISILFIPPAFLQSIIYVTPLSSSPLSLVFLSCPFMLKQVTCRWCCTQANSEYCQTGL